MSYVPATMILLLVMVNFLIILHFYRYYSVNKEIKNYNKIFKENSGLLIKNLYQRKSLIEYMFVAGAVTVLLCISSFVLQKYNLNNAYLYTVLSALILFGACLVFAIIDVLKNGALIQYKHNQSRIQETVIIEHLVTV